MNKKTLQNSFESKNFPFIFQFDIRIYVLLTSLDPLKIYMYDDGLIRIGKANISFQFPPLDGYHLNVSWLYVFLV